MINYNLKFRGPFEYDKFILNILQFHNEVNQFEDRLLKKETDGQDLLNLEEELNDLFDSSMDHSLSEEIHKMFLKIN